MSKVYLSYKVTLRLAESKDWQTQKTGSDAWHHNPAIPLTDSDVTPQPNISISFTTSSFTFLNFRIMIQIHNYA